MVTDSIRDRVVELRRVRANEIIPHEKNAREHPEAQRNALRAVMSQLGFAGAILAVERDGKLKCCDGHLRTEEMGDKEVPVLILDLNDDEVETLLLSFDAIGSMAKFNRERLESLLGTYDRTKATIDPALLNGMQQDLDKMLKSLAKGAGSTWGKTQEALQDEVPEPPAVAITEVGDLWILGRHRLKCGDCTNGEHVAEVLAGGEPFMMVTDPPYGVDYDPQWRHECGLNASDRTGKVANDTVVDWSACYRLFAGAVTYIWHAGKFAGEVWQNIEESGFTVRAQIIWRKTAFVIGRGHYHWQHEPCWYSVREGVSAKWGGDRTQSTVWDITPIHKTRGTVDDQETIHGTQKPVECMARPIRNHGGPEDAVYDPFVGSGTTIIACEQLGRQGYFMEIDPRYADVAAERWGRFTKAEPILESTGETFTQVKERRTAERAQATPDVASTDPPEEPQPAPASTSPAKQPQRQNGKKKRSK
jgi:DNA modification methylase